MDDMHGPLDILLIEDSIPDARLVTELLKDVASGSLRVHVAMQLVDGLALLQQRQFDVVLLDLTLPDADGLASLTRVRTVAPKVPVVVLTGLADAGVAADAVRHGAQDYLVKGDGSGETLHRAIRYAVARHEVVAARELAEQELRESDARYRQLANYIKEGLLLVDLPAMTTTLMNRAWNDLRGTPGDAVADGPWFEGVHADDRDDVLAVHAQVREGKDATHVFRVVRPDGTVRWARGRWFPVVADDGTVPRMVGLIEDITAIRDAEAQLQHSQRMEAVGRLAGGVAHDFNNLLTAILGYTDLAIGALGPRHPVTHDLTYVSNAGRSAASLTNQLLAFSRRQVLQPRPLDLNATVRAVEPLLRRLIGEDIDLHIDLIEPAAPVVADPGQVEQAIMNLAVNARDAMPDGGMLTIQTSRIVLDDTYARQHVEASVGPHVVLSVTDNGVGMDEHVRSHLFEPFFTTKAAGKGTGLGLSTVYGFVRQSHGTIWVYSEVGRGTTVKIYLPAGDQAGESTETEAGGELVHGDETILVVEDQAEVRAIIVATLTRAGYTVHAADSPAAALAIASSEADAIHLLLTDVVMAQLSGRTLARQVTKLWPQIRTIYMSGYTDETIVRHGVLDAGVVFIQKPFSARDLTTRVRQVLDAAAPPLV